MKPFFRILLPVSLSLLVAFIILFLNPDFGQQYVLEPLLYAYLFTKSLVASLNQRYLWYSYLALLVVSAWTSLAFKKRAARRKKTAHQQEKRPVENWLGQINELEDGPYFQWRFAHHIRDLLIQTLAYKHGLSAIQVEEELETGLFDLPDAAIPYLKEAGKRFPTPTPRGFLSTNRNEILDIDPAHALSWIEQILPEPFDDAI
jgi:hypothetical protein